MRNEYCDVLNDGFGCSFRDDKDSFDPQRCIDCLQHMIRFCSEDLIDLFEKFCKENDL